MSLVVTGDFHLGQFRNGPDINGVNGRLLDIKARMWEMLDFLTKHQDASFMMVGDVFKDKHPSIPEMEVFAEFLRELIGLRISSYFITGNHDSSKTVGQPHALAPFMPLTQGTCIRIIDEPAVLAGVGGEWAYFFPYKWHSQDEPLKKFTKDATSADPLFVHGTIEGGSVNKLVDYELFDEDVIQYDTVKQFKMVFAGHLHDAQHFGNVWYPGSIERLAFGDELSPKSFLYVMEEGVQTIPLNARKMVTMHYEQLKELKAGRFSVKDAIVRISGVDRDYIRHTREALMNAGCYYIAGLYTTGQETMELPKATGIDISEFVRRLAAKTGYKGDVKNATKIILETVGNQS